MTTYKKLPKKFKAKWLKALRSGEYKQCKQALCSDGGYCCLGVAGSITGVSDDILKRGAIFDIYDSVGKPNLKPFRTQRAWNIIIRSLPKLLIGSAYENFRGDLTEMNDGGKSFSEIADWIEENL